jgi:hypothetical protein
MIAVVDFLAVYTAHDLGDAAQPARLDALAAVGAQAIGAGAEPDPQFMESFP